MFTLAFFSLLGAVSAQLVGPEKTETHPKLSWQKCTSSGCSNTNGEVVIDANWRWVHTSRSSPSSLQSTTEQNTDSISKSCSPRLHELLRRQQVDQRLLRRVRLHLPLRPRRCRLRTHLRRDHQRQPAQPAARQAERQRQEHRFPSVPHGEQL
jgi:hypothetical protein